MLITVLVKKIGNRITEITKIFFESLDLTKHSTAPLSART